VKTATTALKHFDYLFDIIMVRAVYVLAEKMQDHRSYVVHERKIAEEKNKMSLYSFLRLRVVW